MSDLPKQLSRTEIYKSKWVELFTDKVEMPSGKIIEKYHQLDVVFDSVIILPIRENGDVFFIKSKRYTTGKLEWEIPAGGMDEGETPEVTALRECLEETGYKAANPTLLLTHNPNNGMNNETFHIIKVEVDDTQQFELDTDEVAGTEWLNKKQIRFMIEQNIIKDGKSILPLLMYLAEVNC